MIQDYIEDICDILNIPVPQFSYDTSHFHSNTMMAQVDSAGKVIYLKNTANLILTNYFPLLMNYVMFGKSHIIKKNISTTIKQWMY